MVSSYVPLDHKVVFGQFNCPTAVAILPDGDVFVTDYSKYCVQIFSPDGVFQREFGKGQLNYPHDILITADGHVLGAGSGNNRVVIFNTTGQVILSFQVAPLPCGLAIDHNGDLLVTLLLV